jgi:hypothetical protein
LLKLFGAIRSVQSDQIHVLKPVPLELDREGGELLVQLLGKGSNAVWAWREAILLHTIENELVQGGSRLLGYGHSRPGRGANARSAKLNLETPNSKENTMKAGLCKPCAFPLLCRGCHSRLPVFETVHVFEDGIFALS